MLWLLACLEHPSKPEASADPSPDSAPDTTTDNPQDTDTYDDDLGYTACNPTFPSLSIQTSSIPSTPLLPTANGYVAAVYAIDARQVPVHYTDGTDGIVDQSHAVVAFWDHTMRNPTASTSSEDRLWDLYPGLRVDGVGTWMNTVPETQVAYLEGTGILQVIQQVEDLEVTTHYFTPFQDGGERDLVAVVTVRNVGSTPHTVDLYSLQNAHVDGEGHASQENVRMAGTSVVEKGEEGALLHTPLGSARVAAAPSGTAENPWIRLHNGEDLGDEIQSGDDVAVGFKWSFGSLAAGDSQTRGWVLSWGEDSAALQQRVSAWLGGMDASALLQAEQQDWERWHSVESPPSKLNPSELALYRQSTAVLRMAQVRGIGFGQILASLPPGIWNITWPRDQSFAIQALAASGHRKEAEAAVQFVLDGKAGSYASYLGISDYLVSVARYYGDGTEESDGASCPDGSDAGPNVELDDFGLFLQAWAAAPVAGSETQVQSGVVEPLQALMSPNDLLVADSSIWERHWNNCFPNGRKQFVWSSIQAAAGLAAVGAPSDRLRGGLLSGVAVTENSDGTCPILASAPEEICTNCGPLDASGVELINLGLVRPESALARGSLDAWMALRAPSGGFRRNDDGTGSSNPYPWYDDQEWIFIDLRMAMALHSLATATEDAALQQSAEALLEHVTLLGTANYGLLPELVSDGTYTPEDDADHLGIGQDPGQQAQGAMPMVGFGAGAYILALQAMR